MYKEEENYFDNRVYQFDHDQKRAANAALKKTAKQTKKTSILPSSGNPYIQARHKILEEYPEWRRVEIATMEKNGNTENRHYMDFVHAVAVLGDEIDSGKQK